MTTFSFIPIPGSIAKVIHIASVSTCTHFPLTITTIEYIVKGGDTLDQSVEIALQSGDAPHLLGGGNMMKMAENGYIAPIENMPGGEEFLKKYEGRLVKDKNIYK